VLPEWNLADLYGGIDDPQVKRDLDRAAAESLAFEEAYKGKLAALVERPEAGSALVAAVKRYETLDDLLGRLASYAGLLHAGDTVDPARAKFYADVQERVTAALGSCIRLSVGSMASDFAPTLKRRLAMVSSNSRFQAE